MKIDISYNNQQHYESTLIFFHEFCNLYTQRYELLPILKNPFYVEKNNKNCDIFIPILENLKIYECEFDGKKIVLYEEQGDSSHVVFRSKILVNKKILHIDFQSCNSEYIHSISNKIKSFALNDFKDLECDHISHYVFNNYHEWDKSDNYFKRKLSTLYLPSEKKKELFDDVNNFYNNTDIEIFYKKMNIPQTRVYLFYGYPGTGKTTTSYVIASELNINICTLDFTTKIDDGAFRSSLKSIPDNSLLLIEDIDHLFCPKKEHDDMRHAITFTGLLNIIDGIAKVKKLICIITCNDITALDKTILRRIDYSFEFINGVEEEQLSCFCDELPNNIINDKQKFLKFFKSKQTTMNIIQKWILYHLNNIIMKKYLITDKLEEFNKYNNWYQKTNEKIALYN